MLRTPGSLTAKLLLSLVVLIGVWFYLERIVRTRRAERFADRYNIEGLEQARRLAPESAEFAHMLGLQFADSFEHRQQANENFRSAAALDPNTAQYWLDLASSSQLSGNQQDQRSALEAAVAAEPNNPDVLAEAGQNFLVLGRSSYGLKLLARAMELDPSSAPELIAICWRTTHDLKQMLSEIVPHDAQSQLAFLRLLVEQDDYSSAKEVWRNIASARAPDPHLASFYFDYLIQTHHPAELEQAWREFALAPGNGLYLPGANLIVDPGFELPLLNVGLDWRYQSLSNVIAGIDAAAAHSGSHSLALSYQGPSADDAGWHEFIPVTPGAECRFSAWVKSEGVVSASGPRLILADAYSGTTLLATDDVLETTPWHEVRGNFRIPDETNLLLLKIIRLPSEPKIKGRVWIDDLQLIEN